ncbi:MULTISPECIES: nucleoside triphosphate pyrophosphatase [unclassified Sedimentibacter]|uniref:nucleoside triphosphate pyrophosphatase n=1 Tax=unclassified Sedimentibacter TaxID=2649220 RepID=UPI0027E20D03|nr:Maf family protein [Sedimentibacter sp. MB35-C1]WMJ75882.1 Maf family protein [Sedimentibacter sp. MB35-C1]
MRNIILASKSPRRIEMLEKYVKNLKIFSPDMEESVDENDLPETTVMRLAFEKAAKVAETCDEKGIIIAADTVVYLDTIMGKPNDYDEGFEMLKLLSGKTHKVFTGICIIDNENNRKVVDYEETLVEFNKLSDNFIKRYLDTGEYGDKAGAYGIQGYGELLVKGIHGCYNNVKGMPLSKLNKLLAKHFSYNLL